MLGEGSDVKLLSLCWLIQSKCCHVTLKWKLNVLFWSHLQHIMGCRQFYPTESSHSYSKASFPHSSVLGEAPKFRFLCIKPLYAFSAAIISSVIPQVYTTLRCVCVCVRVPILNSRPECARVECTLQTFQTTKDVFSS